MLFAVHYEITTDNRNATLDRFKQIGDGTPDGLKILGNWFSVTQLEGWAIIDSPDTNRLCRLFYTWTDLNVNHITPVVSESDMREFLNS